MPMMKEESSNTVEIRYPDTWDIVTYRDVRFRLHHAIEASQLMQ